MDIYIKWNNDTDGIQIPILPESFELEGNMQNESVTIQNLGEINLKGKRSLYSISFSSFLLCQNYEFAHGSFTDPYEIIRKIRNEFENNTTIHLIITETNINGFFTIENFNYGHSEKIKDVSYTITLKEYRTITHTDAGPVERQTKAAVKKTVTWKKGDTWQKVTKKALGSSVTWKTQKAKNKAVIKKAKKKHPKEKEKNALVGYKVVITP